MWSPTAIPIGTTAQREIEHGKRHMGVGSCVFCIVRISRYENPSNRMFYNTLKYAFIRYVRFAREEFWIGSAHPPHTSHSPNSSFIHSFIAVRHNFQFKVSSTSATTVAQRRPRRTQNTATRIQTSPQNASWEVSNVAAQHDAHIVCWIWILWSTMIPANAIIYLVPYPARVAHADRFR